MIAVGSQPIIIRLVTCRDHTSGIIRRGELGFWASHAELLTPDGFLLGAHIDGGVMKRVRDYDKGQWIQELIVGVPATATQEIDFWNFANSQIGKPYDIEAIVKLAEGELTGFVTLSDNAGVSWICSAYVTGCLLAAGLVHCAPSSLRLTSPRDLMQMLAALAWPSSPQTPSGAFLIDPFVR